MIRLEVLEGVDLGRVVESTGDQLVIGRATQAGFQLNDVHLSSEHGVVFYENGQYVYRDLHSTNGSMVLRGETRTVLDGSNRWESPLSDGDRLLLGDANTPVVLLCSVHDEQRKRRPSERIIATRGLNELKAVTSRLEQGPEVSALYRALKMVGGRLELDEVLDAVAAAVFELAPKATHLSILLRDGQSRDRFVPMLARSRTGSEQPDSVMMSRAVLKRVLDDQAAVLAANAMDELGSSESIMGANIHSTVGVPLRCGDQIIGVIEADNRAGSGMFTGTDLERLMVLAEQAALAVENAQLYQQLKVAQEKAREENLYLKGRQKKHARFEHIIGDSAAMKAIFEQVERVIDTRATVCIGGETGTGKELIASAIHYQGKRSDKMFVAQNCAALPENLLESELFGHKRGSFTGADQDKKGLFEIADAGTLFLDEIAEMPLALQAKLLRVLQEGEVRPVGATRAKRVDVRIICATNRSLEQEVEAQRFRQDLFYRLMVFPLVLPPLRERVDDISLLAQHFLKRYTSEMHKAVGGISQEALNHLRSYRWPGNIRELENEVQRLVIQLDDGEIIQPDHLSPHVRRVEGMVARVAPRKGTLKEMMESVERWMLSEALKEHGNNKTKTAASLGITREGLHKKLAKHGL